MTREFEKKLYFNVLVDINIILQNEDDDVTSNYYECWTYLNEVINIVSDNASNWLLNKLYKDRDYYQNKYLTFKGLK